MVPALHRAGRKTYIIRFSERGFRSDDYAILVYSMVSVFDRADRGGVYGIRIAEFEYHVFVAVICMEYLLGDFFRVLVGERQTACVETSEDNTHIRALVELLSGKLEHAFPREIDERLHVSAFNRPEFGVVS